MKFLLLFLTFFLIGLIAYAQDTLITKSGNTMTVKILNVEDSTIYFYQTIDKLKQVRAISVRAIKGYKYDVFASATDINDKKADSILYLNYVRKTKGLEPVLITSSTETNFDSTRLKTNNTVIATNKYSPTVNSYYGKAGRNIIVSGVLLFVGSALQIYNVNREIDENATLEEVNRFIDVSKNLSNVSYGLFGASGIFMIGAGININNGSVKLK
jgi:hypothetical protein